MMSSQAQGLWEQRVLILFFSNSFLEIDSKISHQSNNNGSRECDVKNPEENKEKLDPRHIARERILG